MFNLLLHINFYFLMVKFHIFSVFILRATKIMYRACKACMDTLAGLKDLNTRIIVCVQSLIVREIVCGRLISGTFSLVRVFACSYIKLRTKFIPNKIARRQTFYGRLRSSTIDAVLSFYRFCIISSWQFLLFSTCLHCLSTSVVCYEAVQTPFKHI